MKQGFTQCHQCTGIGKLFLRNGRFIKCDMCEGTGEYIGNLLWFIQGLKIRDWRKEREVTLRDAAKYFHIDASNLSKMERGIIKPDSDCLKVILKG